MALILLALSALLVVPILNLASTSLNYHRVIERNTLEAYSADSGIEYALCQLGNDPEGYQEGPLDETLTINDMVVDVTAQYLGGGIYKVTSVATTESGSTSIESHVFIGSALFKYAIASLDGNLSITGNALVTSSPDSGEGNVYANGSIDLTGNVRVEGDATATGEISVGGNSTITGETKEGAQPLDLPQVDISEYLDEANEGELIVGDLRISGNGYYDLGPAHITGDLKISGNRTVTLRGTVYVEGKIKMSGNTRIEGPGTVVSEGNIEVTGNSKLEPEDIPTIISVSGSIQVTGNNWTSAILYAPNGEVAMSGNSKIYGSIVAGSVSVVGNSKVDYPVDVVERTDLPGGAGLNVVSYQVG